MALGGLTSYKDYDRNFAVISKANDRFVKQKSSNQESPKFIVDDPSETKEDLITYKGIHFIKKFFHWISRFKVAHLLGMDTYNRFDKSKPNSGYKEFTYHPNTKNYGLSEYNDDHSYKSHVFKLIKDSLASENAYNNLEIDNSFIVKTFHEMGRIIDIHSENKVSHSKYGAMFACIKDNLMKLCVGGNRDLPRQNFKDVHLLSCAEDSGTKASLLHNAGLPKVLFLRRKAPNKKLKSAQLTPCIGCMRNFAKRVYDNKGIMVIVSTKEQLENINKQGLFLNKDGDPSDEQLRIYSASDKALMVIPWFRMPDLKMEFKQGGNITRSKKKDAPTEKIIRAGKVLNEDEMKKDPEFTSNIRKLEDYQREKLKATLKKNFSDEALREEVKNYYNTQDLKQAS